MSIMRELREEFGLQSDRVQTKQYVARYQMFQQICDLYYTISDKQGNRGGSSQGAMGSISG